MRSKTRRCATVALCTLPLLAIGLEREARAVDLPKIGDSPVKLDITETSIFAQRFAPRDWLSTTLGNDTEIDQGYFVWLNRMNLVLGWKKFTLGARIDSALYAFTPVSRASTFALVNDSATRYRDSIGEPFPYIHPAKLWIGYKNEGFEITAGDSYVQFGRGLVLSLRKVDELGIDTTLFGGKITVQKDPFAVVMLAGLANPARVDEPTGRALFPSASVPKQPGARPGVPDISPAVPTDPMFGSDRIVGAQLQAGRGLPITASTHAVRLTKCAPYRYDPVSNDTTNIVNEPFDKPIGTCEESDRTTWLSELKGLQATGAARETTNAGQSIEIPSLWGHGSLYIEGAMQKREPLTAREAHTQGNAIYGSLVTTGGPISNTIEVKSYRNFYPLVGSVNITRASAFANLAYSIPPTSEPIIADTMFGNFNLCVTGGRDRFDYRFTPTFLAYATYGYYYTRTEIFGGSCDRNGKSTASGVSPAETTNYVNDASLGVEWRFDDDKSIVFANVNARHDITESNDPYYREVAGQYSITKYIKGPYAFELAGRHRYRVQDHENIRDPSSFRGEPWWQGEHQNALKIAPKWVISQGFEYTTLVGFPTYYLNATVLYRFTSESNIRIYAGQNRGGLRCVSGICRQFPAFSGARIELTLRF